MANVFDQFDEKPVSRAAANPFDRFDKKPPFDPSKPFEAVADKPPFDPTKPFQAVASKPPFDPSKPFEKVDLGALSDDELRALHASASTPGDLSKMSDADLIAMHNASKPSVAADVAKAAPIGLAKGAIGVAGMPGDMQSMGNSLVDRIMLGAIHKGQDWTGYGPQAGTPDRDRFDNLWNMIGSGSNVPTSGDIQGTIEKATGPFYKPQTRPGKFAETIGEFAPAAAVGNEGAMARIIGNVVVPAVTSEAAGEASEGTKFEPLMRFLGGLFGNAGTAVGRARSGAPDRMVREAVNGVTPQEYDSAAALQARGANIGVRLSGPETVQAATNGATRLGDVQRVVEGSTGGGTQMARFYSERPGQVDAATGRALDAIAPASAAPSTVGPRAAEAAANELDQVRRGINTATRPAYQAAEGHVMDPADFAPIADDPAFQASLRRLRNDEVLGPMYEHHPDNSVAVIDAATKDMRDRGVALSNASNPGFSSQTAGRYTQGSHDAREIARDPARGGVQEYDDALTAQEQARRQNLEPLEQGPLGRLAKATDTRTAGDIVLPAKPLTGGERELVDTIMRTEARDPGAGAALVRQNLADRYDQSASRLVGGENQYGGARFAKEIAGTPQAETNLNAVVGALPTGAVAQPSMQDLVDVLRATGMRKPQGSATEFNRQLNHELQLPPISAELAVAAKTGGVSALSTVSDRAKRAWLGRGTSQLSDLFVAPDSVDQIRAIAARAADTPGADAMLRQVLQTPAEMSGIR
jgi:hypothetical protein